MSFRRAERIDWTIELPFGIEYGPSDPKIWKEVAMLSKVLAILGLLAMLLGGLDPLEGSVVILPGVGLATLGAVLGHSRFTKLLCWSLACVALGIGAMFAMGAMGGFAGRRDHLMWWGLLMAPYPLGYLLGLVGAALRVVEAFRHGPVTVAARMS